MNEKSPEGTPRPGVRLPKNEEKQISGSFFRRFRNPAKGRPRDLPTWCTFGEDAQRVTPDIVNDPALDRLGRIHVFFEGGREVYEADIADVRTYFAKKQPWEDYDIYLFDDEMSWCITITHELMHGPTAFVIGTIP